MVTLFSFILRWCINIGGARNICGSSHPHLSYDKGLLRFPKFQKEAPCYVSLRIQERSSPSLPVEISDPVPSLLVFGGWVRPHAFWQDFPFRSELAP
jgi:hypothetical protein